jgi:hypothetical protein
VSAAGDVVADGWPACGVLDGLDVAVGLRGADGLAVDTAVFLGRGIDVGEGVRVAGAVVGPAESLGDGVGRDGGTVIVAAGEGMTVTTVGAGFGVGRTNK